jgi:hypothetical protein
VSSVTGSPASRRVRGQSRPVLWGWPQGRLPDHGVPAGGLAEGGGRQQGIPAAETQPQGRDQGLAHGPQVPLSPAQAASPTGPMPLDEDPAAGDRGPTRACAPQPRQGPHIAAVRGDVGDQTLLAPDLPRRPQRGGHVGIHRTPPRCPRSHGLAYNAFETLRIFPDSVAELFLLRSTPT